VVARRFGVEFTFFDARRFRGGWGGVVAVCRAVATACVLRVPYCSTLIVVCVCDGSRYLEGFAMSISIGLIVVTWNGGDGVHVNVLTIPLV
jgi:hypothetical protein